MPSFLISIRRVPFLVLPREACCRVERGRFGASPYELEPRNRNWPPALWAELFGLSPLTRRIYGCLLFTMTTDMSVSGINRPIARVPGSMQKEISPKAGQKPASASPPNYNNGTCLPGPRPRLRPYTCLFVLCLQDVLIYVLPYINSPHVLPATTMAQPAAVSTPTILLTTPPENTAGEPCRWIDRLPVPS